MKTTNAVGQVRTATEPPEGVAWLGRRPDNHAGLLLRALARLGMLVATRIAGLRIEVEGQEHFPTGGSIVACAAHRSWIDAPLLVGVLPLEPRIWYLGSGAATFRCWWREPFMRHIGGILPVYRGGLDVDIHVESARAVLEARAVFGIFPEGSRAGPPTSIAAFRRGIGLIGLRTGAPIVPVALGGTAELYRGRRIRVRALPPTTALELARLDQAPAVGSAEELDAARAATVGLQQLLAGHVAALATAAEDPPATPRRWLWLTTLVR